MDPKLLHAIEFLHAPTDGVHLATVGRDGGPHVTPMMMGLRPPQLLSSLTGKQKVRNLERDARACVALRGAAARAGQADVARSTAARPSTNARVTSATCSP